MAPKNLYARFVRWSMALAKQARSATGTREIDATDLSSVASGMCLATVRRDGSAIRPQAVPRTEVESNKVVITFPADCVLVDESVPGGQKRWALHLRPADTDGLQLGKLMDAIDAQLAKKNS
ncbi:hypothetical protein [Caballeronia sp. dw_19]|uniref:hypothetical protein n=1 Tax=Caballeronia sp. dw_19 TaxID=2719791 RepID=UPI001BD179B5|nr:hypothetical protein [Caballeronia sp. dw_19]